MSCRRVCELNGNDSLAQVAGEVKCDAVDVKRDQASSRIRRAGSTTAHDVRKQLNALIGPLRPVNDETTAEDIARVRADVASLPVSAGYVRAVESVRRTVPKMRRSD